MIETTVTVTVTIRGDAAGTPAAAERLARTLLKVSANADGYFGATAKIEEAKR